MITENKTLDSEPVALPPRNNQHIIDFVRGVSASALLYSSAKSAKANQLKPYEYFTYLLKGSSNIQEKMFLRKN